MEINGEGSVRPIYGQIKDLIQKINRPSILAEKQMLSLGDDVATLADKSSRDFGPIPYSPYLTKNSKVRARKENIVNEMKAQASTERGHSRKYNKKGIRYDFDAYDEMDQGDSFLV